MVTSNGKIFSVDELIDYLDGKGDLHDCVIESLHWQPTEKLIEIRFADINANFRGLPEYVGPVLCAMQIEGVEDFVFNLSNPDDRLRTYEVSVSSGAQKMLLKILFYPSGSLELSFTDLKFLELS
jgi:hypothetical protein